MDSEEVRAKKSSGLADTQLDSLKKVCDFKQVLNGEVV